MSDILRRDPVLRPVVDTIRLEPLSREESVYFSLTRSIISQQLSVKAAATIFRRFLERFDDGHPHPDQLLAMDTAALREAGISQQKAGYLQNIAAQAQADDWNRIDWHGMSDKEVLDYLTKIKGVGVWTVQMILIFTMQRPDIFSPGDLGIQQAMKMLYGLEQEGRPLIARMEEIAEAWSPDRSLACRYLWQWKDSQK